MWVRLCWIKLCVKRTVGLVSLQHQYETHTLTAPSICASLSLSLALFLTFLEHPVLSVLVFLLSPGAKSSACTRRVSVHEHVDTYRFPTYTCSGDQLSKHTQCCFVCLPSRTQVGHYLLADVPTRRSVCLLSVPHEPHSWFQQTAACKTFNYDQIYLN